MSSDNEAIVEDAQTVSGIIGKLSSNGIPRDELKMLTDAMSRMVARFAMKALDYVEFHQMDENLSEGKIDPRYVPVIKRSIEMASPDLYPESLKPLAKQLKEQLSGLEKALVRNDIDEAKSLSHHAHENYHELQHELSKWLDEGKVG
ncbi:MAG: hypothetical protein HY296_08280 [Thaumarchaeota archaeon]|nr:hypothetical protein [Nitrososphaerota archaeon]